MVPKTQSPSLTNEVKKASRLSTNKSLIKKVSSQGSIQSSQSIETNHSDKITSKEQDQDSENHSMGNSDVEEVDFSFFEEMFETIEDSNQVP